MTEIRITVSNTSDLGGTFLTPFWFGFHDSSFDVFTSGLAASDGLEMIAEDGDASGLGAELAATDGDGQGGVVTGERGPIATREQTSTIVDVDGVSNGFLSLAAMLLPSNDAFVATRDALQLFDGAGNFLGAQNMQFEGDDVYDAGTEVNTELDAAFLNQMGPNTGVDENGVITLHPGFNGSAGNPVGEGDQLILGGTNAFGFEIDEVAADFTLDGAQIANVHANLVTRTEGDDEDSNFIGDATDDLVDGLGGDDRLLGRDGYDVLDGGRGEDTLQGGRGRDELFGNRSDDLLRGGRGDDLLEGGAGDDRLSGGQGNDVLDGGTGTNQLFGREGADIFLFTAGENIVRDFDRAEGDRVVLELEALGLAEGVTIDDLAEEQANGVLISVDEDTSLLLVGQ
ncbi:MAG: spondin domain-containing protein, partial [Pseudomonadota bacterium]